jgi:hypothetical protein
MRAVDDGAVRVHSLVSLTRRLLRTAGTDTYGRVVCYGEHRLDLTVSRDSLERALGFWDSFIRACAARGWKVSIEGERQGETVVTVDGERLVLRLREGYRREPFRPTEDERREAKRRGYPTSWPTWRHRPSGACTFTVTSKHTYRELITLRDGRHRLEDQLPGLIEALPETARTVKAAREAAAQAEVRRREEETRRWKEVERRRQEEVRRSGLMAEATRWHRSRQLRAYARAVARKAGTLAAGSKLEAWVRWAERVADDLDPLVKDRYADDAGRPFGKPPWWA